MLGQQLLQVRLGAVLDQAGVDAPVVRGVVLHLVDADHELVGCLRVGDGPEGGNASIRLVAVGLGDGDRAGRAHPVEWLVGAAVGVHEHTPVGLDHQQTGGHRQVRAETPGIVNRTFRNYKAHWSSLRLLVVRGREHLADVNHRVAAESTAGQT